MVREYALRHKRELHAVLEDLAGLPVHDDSDGPDDLDHVGDATEPDVLAEPLVRVEILCDRELLLDKQLSLCATRHAVDPVLEALEVLGQFSLTLDRCGKCLMHCVAIEDVLALIFLHVLGHGRVPVTLRAIFVVLQFAIRPGERLGLTPRGNGLDIHFIKSLSCVTSVSLGNIPASSSNVTG